MVGEDDVRAAYRLILGREPESEDVLTRHAQQFTSLEHMRAAFLSSPEFHSIIGTGLRPLDWPPMEVETNASPSQLLAMMRHIEQNWHQLGVSEPHWSVLSKETFRASNIAVSEEQFYYSGGPDVERLKRTAERCGVSLAQYRRCFELGCGVGRLTIWLADLFDTVIAADISQAHLALARQALDRLGRANVDLVHVNSFATFESIPEFDFFFSLIVLQHNPPPLIDHMLRELLKRLRPGGIAYFQVPTYRAHYRFRINEYLKEASSVGTIEMHLIPQRQLFEIIKRSGCNLLECREDSAIGDYHTISNSIFLKKQEIAA